MDNYRLILSVTLVFLGMLLWTNWQQETNVKPKLESVKNNAAGVVSDDVPVAAVEPGKSIDLPKGANGSDKKIVIKTDLLSVELDLLGGTLIKVDLLAYPVSTKDVNEPFSLISNSPSNYFIAQNGLLSTNSSVPNHKELFYSDKLEYELTEEDNKLEVVLSWEKDNIGVRKIYTFHRGSYEINLVHEIVNNSGKIVTVRDYRQFVRSNSTGEKQSAFIYTFTGGAYYSPEEKFTKLDFDTISKEKLEKDISGGWIAMMQHYFLGAFIPVQTEMQHYYSKDIGDGKYLLGLYSQALNIPNGNKHAFDGKLWIGPKLQDRLEQVATGLEFTTDYGWLTVIAKPLFWILKYIHELVGNWGWAIVFLTMLIKLVFYRLSATSYRSMAGMRKLSPRLQTIKERYGDDKEKFNKAMMELYQKEKINPVGGCLPILVQIPVFIALYWVLLESVELRNAPFMLWIDNLSEKDPYFILPLVMGISMFVQQKLNPAPPDPMQAKIMMSLPFIFTVFFAFFPSGLVLYWVVNNLLSIIQQWRITTLMEQKG